MFNFVLGASMTGAGLLGQYDIGSTMKKETTLQLTSAGLPSRTPGGAFCPLALDTKVMAFVADRMSLVALDLASATSQTASVDSLAFTR